MYEKQYIFHHISVQIYFHFTEKYKYIWTESFTSVHYDQTEITDSKR